MAEATAIETAISESATDGVRKASGDAGSMEGHSLPDQIAADRYLCGKKAASNLTTAGGKLPFSMHPIRYGGTT